MSNPLETLANSNILHEYAEAFTSLTGLPLALCPVECWQLSLHGKRNEARYCALLSRNPRACASCLSVMKRLSRLASEHAQTVHCPSGLCVTAVPVRLGNALVGFLKTGQVFCARPTEGQFRVVAKHLKKWGLGPKLAEVRAAYFANKVVPQRRYRAMIKLLASFSEHLATFAQPILLPHERQDLPLIRLAKDYVQEHQREKLRLARVARICKTSTYYFGKRFKAETGSSFAHYLARVRVEESKKLLLNPNLQIRDIASQVGFKSVKHFSRVFKNIVRQAPGAYRRACAAQVCSPSG